ncbi:MAG TPA: hypothetical protein ENK13_03025 [Thermopetrobacter sp.]|nr:hypothetical protein [Thermopetrobacter sp.]
MIFDPPILALLLAAALAVLVVVPAALFAVRVLRHWDVRSGTAAQIAMERRTYLVTTALKLVLLLQMAALALFVHNADRMAVLFTGAMCALGTLNVNAYGMPAFLLQVAVFFAAAVWLVVNHADERGRDYPYTRLKYALLLAFAPLVVAAAGFEWLYFLNLDPNVITSCCSKLFTPEASGAAADLSALPPRLALGGLFGGLVVLAALGWLGRDRRPARIAFGLLSVAWFLLAVAGIISALAPYVYETPNHHCPFCILKPQYGFIGYALYLPLFAATALAAGVGLLSALATPASLKGVLEPLLARLSFVALACYAAFGLIAAHTIWRSHLILIG